MNARVINFILPVYIFLYFEILFGRAINTDSDVIRLEETKTITKQVIILTTFGEISGGWGEEKVLPALTT